MRLPDWIGATRVAHQHNTKRLLRKHGLLTVCEDARCPNKSMCFTKPTATFMILGQSCTRTCGFCSVKGTVPGPVNRSEPEQIACAAEEMRLAYIVITSVTRDDLPDGGASHFARTIVTLRKRLPQAKVEVLTPDFKGNDDAVKVVVDACPDVFNHNMETVRRLYPIVRPHADYLRSLSILRKAKDFSSEIHTKSGFMLGLGESMHEVHRLLKDLRKVGCDFITIGQYLRPTKNNLPVVKYIKPAVFDTLKVTGIQMGFRHVSSGPLVRSSMNADELYEYI
ncbi:MAG: lipoyl synthase [Nitrospiraceae bacterium]|nr:MAG: lipoyl synthase [Nitrospiraceae bacterium]